MDELTGKGSFYTWSNKRDFEDRIYSKIDRIFINETWFLKFPLTEVEFGAPGVSNHSPICFEVRKQLNFQPKSFKFQKFCMQHEQFPGLLRKTWAIELNVKS